jgi:tRNA(His) 5'-end guanylyltransferase
MRGRWRTKDTLVRAIVSACHRLVEEKGLRIEFRHQRGHASTLLSKNDFAHYNARADQLASEARSPATESFHAEGGTAPAGRAAARKGRKRASPGPR